MAANVMTPERAREVWRTNRWGIFDTTPEEDAYIDAVWRGMPGDTSWADALLKIGRGEVVGERFMIERWQCQTCMRQGKDAPPARCPACLSEADDNHGPRLYWRKEAIR